MVDRYFLVLRGKGAAWDHSRGRREQVGWHEHAAFMDGLVEDGSVVLGGPIGEGEGEDTLQVMEAEDEQAVRACLAEDPWGEDMLVTKSVEPWQVWLRRD
jgi:uncharacterized protein YciI